DLLQMRSETVELERIRRGNERPVDQMRFHDASELAPEPQPAFQQGLAMPTSLGFLREGIEALGNIGRSGLRLLRILEHFGAKRTGDRRLLNNEARIAAVQAFEDRADPACGLDDVAQVSAASARIVAGHQDRVFESFADEIILKCALILEVALGLAA